MSHSDSNRATPQPELRLHTAQPARHPSPTVKAQRLMHLVFERPDVDLAIRFLLDFGLQLVQRDANTAYLRARDGSAYCYRIERAKRARFVGFAFEVPDHAALERLSRVAGASAIHDLEAPGGGKAVLLQDPSGFQVEAIAGQSGGPAQAHRAPLALNVGGRHNRVNALQRPPLLPPDILRLGHLVLELADYQATCAWYCQHFGLLASDIQLLPDGSPAVAFMRLDLGTQPADHHTLALAQGFQAAYSHSAYEVVDPDAVAIGQRLLQERGWNHAWGIGRHILGSQIFDYWQDPWSAKHEHYCDGDLLTAEIATGLHAVNRQAMAQWGQPMPASFTRPRLSLAMLRALWRNLRRSPDLSVRKLLLLARLFG